MEKCAQSIFQFPSEPVIGQCLYEPFVFSSSAFAGQVLFEELGRFFGSPRRLTAQL